MPIKFLVLGGGGVFWVLGGGGSADSIFMGAGIFLNPVFANRLANWPSFFGGVWFAWAGSNGCVCSVEGQGFCRTLSECGGLL